MKIIKLIPTLFLLFGAVSCNGNKQVYLKIGQTQRSGSFSQTLVRLDYSRYAYDENRTSVELEFVLHSYNSNIVSLSSSYFSINVDGKQDNYNYQSANIARSIAPGSDETVIVEMSFFKDWKNASIIYGGGIFSNSDVQFTINLRSTDFPETYNNNYPVLNYENRTIEVNNGQYEVTLDNFATTTIGSAYTKDNETNLMLDYSIKNNTDEILSLGNTYTCHFVKTYNTSEDCHLSISTPILSDDTIEKGQYGQYKLIITVTNTWEKMIITYSTRLLKYSFVLIHSDFTLK